MIIKIFQVSFHVFVCAFCQEISSFFGKSFPVLFLLFCVIHTSVLSFPHGYIRKFINYIVYFYRPTGGTGLSNGPSFRRPPITRPISVSSQVDGGGVGHHIQVVTVIVHKDENGYGMKVSGDNPVYVQSVKDGKYFIY